MFLEKIEIQGFKSFAEPTALVFNKDLTAIVGPNGSGKSNVADAIRWVLGEQSLKLLRGKKSDDVIFAGSDSKGRLGFARVALHLHNHEHEAGVEYDTIVIERTINRTGESEYVINGTPVRLSDVQLLLAKAQVGQKSYSVVGQGMIDSLLTFSASERRDFFDEATGVKHYQLKKNQALHKLEQTEENLKQAELVLQELEPRLRTLHRQVRRLERKEELERELVELHRQYYGFLTTELNQQLTDVRAKKEKAEANLTHVTNEQHKIQTALDKFEQEQGRDERYQSLQAKLFHAQQEYNALTKKKVILEGQRDLDLIKTGQGDVVAARQRLDDIVSKLRTLTARATELTQQVLKQQRLTGQITTQVEDAKTKLTSLEQELAHSNERMDWDSISQEAKLLHHDHETIRELLQSLDAPESVHSFRERFHTFSEKLTSFLHSLQQGSSVDHAALWSTFRELNQLHDDLRAKLHGEETALRLSQQELASIDQQVTVLKQEEKSLRADLETNHEAKRKSLAEDLGNLNQDITVHEQLIQKLRAEIDQFNQTEENKTAEMVNLQKQFRDLQHEATQRNNELTGLKVDVAKLETRKEDLDKEITIEAPEVDLVVIQTLDVPSTLEQINTAKRQLSIIGGIDQETVKEYQEVNDKFSFLTQQTTDLRHAQKSLTQLIADLDQQISKQFQAAFKTISANFTKYFKQLFNGGQAKLILNIHEPAPAATAQSENEDSIPGEETDTKPNNRAFDYSIEIQATPPGKKLSNISMLSGGEKALTSIALICSIIAHNPPPFVVLDEVDAALDEANSIRFAEIISELVDKTQFITITHNRATMHQAKILYGITMGNDGVSRMLSVNFDQADKLSA